MVLEVLNIKDYVFYVIFGETGVRILGVLGKSLTVEVDFFP